MFETIRNLLGLNEAGPKDFITPDLPSGEEAREVYRQSAEKVARQNREVRGRMAQMDEDGTYKEIERHRAAMDRALTRGDVNNFEESWNKYDKSLTKRNNRLRGK